MAVAYNGSGDLTKLSYRERTQNWWTTDDQFIMNFQEDDGPELPGADITTLGRGGDDVFENLERESRVNQTSRSPSIASSSRKGSVASSRGSIKRQAPSIPSSAASVATIDEEDQDLFDTAKTSHPVQVNSGIGNRRHPSHMRAKNTDANRWISADPKHGYIRVYSPNNLDKSQLLACTTDTPAYKVCFQLGIAPNALHIQYGDAFTRRLAPNERPLQLQNDYLVDIGYDHHRRIQKLGTSWELGYMVRLYSGGPIQDSTLTSNVLHGVIDVHKGKVFKSWNKSLCILNGTRLFVYKDTLRIGRPLVLFLEKGEMVQFRTKTREFCLRVTSHLQNKTIRLSLPNEQQFFRWQLQIKKAITKLPTSADLSSCNLEALPEPLFNHGGLLNLNLRKNTMKHRPDITEGGQLLGWIEDIPRFAQLKVLNLADNDLQEFPRCLCEIATLTTLNLSSNKISSIPKEIILLRRLESLHVHNNHLMHLPREMVQLSYLTTIVLAFNRFETIPVELCKIAEGRNTSVIMAGNRVSEMDISLLTKMQFISKMDLRFNKLTLTNQEAKHLHLLSNLCYLDVRDNVIEILDLRRIKTLEYVNCERNRISRIYLDGTKLKYLNASDNILDLLSLDHQPEWLEYLNLRRNKIKALPEFIPNCHLLHHLDVSHNNLSSLPSSLFAHPGSQLRILVADHNFITALPDDIVYIALEELYLQYNWINSLPQNFLKNSNKLRILNLSKNRLVNLPPLHPTVDKNKVQELYLSFNYLRNNCLSVICGYLRLKILNLSHNRISLLLPVDLMKLEFLRELNISGNRLQGLPRCILILHQLHTLRAHSNALVDIPELSDMKSLKVLDLGCNHLRSSSIRSLVDSKLSLLDISCNQSINVTMKDFHEVKTKKKICLVDMTGENRSIPGSIPVNIDKQIPLPFAAGLAETAGQRNKLCVSVIKKLNFPTPDSATFAMFDGGYNNTIPKLLQTHFPFVILEELKAGKDDATALKYTMLTCHKKLKAAGQRLGASGAICYLKRIGDTWRLNICNAGDVEVVVSQGGLPVVLSRRHRLDEDREEAMRIIENDGIITEDGKLNGVSLTSRMVGCNYLYPQLLPDPHVAATTLSSEDDAVIIANRHLWNVVKYEEAVYEVNRIRQPVVAAKRLLDLAQSYGSHENTVILVLKFSSDSDSDPYSLANEWRYDEYEDDIEDDYENDIDLDSSLQSIQSLDSLNHFQATPRRKQLRMSDSGSNAQPKKSRLYMKKHETDELDLQLRLRLADEVKTWEMGAMVRSLSQSSEFTGEDGNWMTVLKDSFSQSGRVNSYLGQAYTSMTKDSQSTRPVHRNSLEWNVDMHVYDRVGDATISPPSESDCSSRHSSRLSMLDIEEEEEENEDGDYDRLVFSKKQDSDSDGTVVNEENDDDEYYVYNTVDKSKKERKNSTEIICSLEKTPPIPPKMDDSDEEAEITRL